MDPKTETVSGMFETDHREIDALLGEARFDSPRRALPPFEEFDRRLEAHIGWEEELLFPAVVRRAPHLEHGPIKVMRMEHEDIRANKAAALKALRDGNGPLAEKHARMMKEILTGHNLKEERVLYPACDELLTAEEARGILAEVRRRRKAG